MFLAVCEYRGIDIFVTETHRSQERQDYLYEQGRTRPGKVVTWTRSSNHTAGYAWDIAVNPPKDLYDKSVINSAGEVARLLDITWGGDWKTPDTPHFQVDKDWRYKDVPRWQIDASILACNEHKLELDTWLSKIDKTLTVGEFLAINRKMVK